MDEDLKDEIRNVIREEIRRASSDTTPNFSSRSSNPSTNDLINRTRHLISNSAASAVRQFNYQHTRPVPNHNNRLSSGKGRKRSVEKHYTFELQVLKHWQGPHNEDNSVPDYGINDSFILIRQVILDLHNNMKEFDIKQKIVNACRTKLPNLKIEDFIFVKREKNKICTPTFGNDFNFDFTQVKKLAGNGKIYIRLKQDAAIVDDSSDDDDELPIPSFM